MSVSGSSRVGIKIRFQAHFWIGKCFHKKSISVCVLAPVGNQALPGREEQFRTFTRDLKRLRTWLLNCRVTDIVMESTGQYWRSIWNILEDAFPKMILVNPLHVKVLKGRKTDRLDARWLATRLERDDLRGQFHSPARHS